MPCAKDLFTWYFFKKYSFQQPLQPADTQPCVPAGSHKKAILLIGFLAIFTFFHDS